MSVFCEFLHAAPYRHSARIRLTAIGISLVLLGAAACGGGSALTGPAAASCGAGPYFTVLPVALGDIDAITVVGGIDAPGHTLPTDHAGIFLRTEGAAVFAPGTMQITTLRRTTYVVSPRRQGHTDFAAFFQVCDAVSGWFGHHPPANGENAIAVARSARTASALRRGRDARRHDARARSVPRVPMHHQPNDAISRSPRGRRPRCGHPVRGRHGACDNAKVPL